MLWIIEFFATLAIALVLLLIVINFCEKIDDRRDR